MLQQEKNVRGPPPEEEGAAETTRNELTATPVPCPPVPPAGEKVEKIKSEAEPKKNGGVGARCF